MHRALAASQLRPPTAVGQADSLSPAQTVLSPSSTCLATAALSRCRAPATAAARA